MSTRVHELAKELGLKSQDLLDRIQKWNLDVKANALAVVDPPTVEQVRELMARESNGGAAAPKPAAAEETARRPAAKPVEAPAASTSPAPRPPWPRRPPRRPPGPRPLPTTEARPPPRPCPRPRPPPPSQPAARRDRDRRVPPHPRRPWPRRPPPPRLGLNPTPAPGRGGPPAGPGERPALRPHASPHRRRRPPRRPEAPFAARPGLGLPPDVGRRLVVVPTPEAERIHDFGGNPPPGPADRVAPGPRGLRPTPRR
ncbi:translation initiation factor IF-2 N-terminal domain-containing protein [Paludisphaera mucosa]|uniref:translation initiation factor IF-2 N-terminal domain-containing protein n=1 Tax=Paludisphaera mucosa TaxID=3030827 RepID=UPI0034A188A6